MQPKVNQPNWIQYCTAVFALFLIIGMLAGWGNIQAEKVKYPTAQDIADLIVIPEVEIPEITIPEAQDTHLSVRDEKKGIAESLVLEEIEKEDFLEDLADFLTEESCEEIDIEEKDITNIVIKETEFKGFSTNMPTYDEDGIVELEVKIYFNNDGDDDEAEKAKAYVTFYIEDLVYDDNYEDAEVDDYEFELAKCYGDLECFCE